MTEPAGAVCKKGLCALDIAQCEGDEMCFHLCYDQLTPDAMRAAVRYDSRSWPGSAERERWAARLAGFVDARVSPYQLRRSGVGAPLLAYCNITLEALVMPRSVFFTRQSHYFLEHLIDAFDLTYDDLLLLGFELKHFAQPHQFPLIVLYDALGFRAEHLFRFHMSFGDLHRLFLDVDVRYAWLLRLNLDYWRSALTQGARIVK